MKIQTAPRLLLPLFCFLLSAFSFSAAATVTNLHTINVGSVANDRTGDSLRVAFQKANSNFVALATNSGGAGEVTTVQLNAASNAVYTAFLASDVTTSNDIVTLLVANDTTTSNALRTFTISGLTNKVENLIGLATNLTLYSGTTNRGNLYTEGGSLYVSNAAPLVVQNSYSSTAALSGQLLHQRYRGNSTTPTPIQSGDVIGTFQTLGYGDTVLRGAVTLETKAYGPFSDTEAPSLFYITVGRTNSGTVKQTVLATTATRWTNNVDVILNSNLLVMADTTLMGNANVASNLSVTGSVSTIGIPGIASALTLYETSQVKYVQLQGADRIQTNHVILTSTNATAGVRVLQPAGVGTNQDHAVALLPGQFVTYDGTKYIGTNVYTNSSVVAGTGNGSTNYLIPLLPHPNLNDFNLGSSNVNIYQVTGGTLGAPIYWNAAVTNLSASTWGISFAAAGTTNRWKFSGVYGTNAPNVLTNNTALLLSGRTDGTNTWIGYTYFAPGL